MQFFHNAALESKEVLCDVQNSLNEQKRMLAFSAQQHSEVSYMAWDTHNNLLFHLSYGWLQSYAFLHPGT